MRIIGIVRWKSTDKMGNPIAGVEPLYEIEEDNWRQVNNILEFPTSGLAFWPIAREAFKDLIVFFETEDNIDQKYKYKVVNPRPALEVVDLRELGNPGVVKSALTLGLRRHEFRECHALIRCAPDFLIGPVKLVKKRDGLFIFEASNPDRIKRYAGGNDEELRTINDGSITRTILPRPLGAMAIGAPTGYVDWDDDRLIVRRALKAAVARAKRAGNDPGLTKRMIDEAVESVTGDGGGLELELEHYRYERAHELCSEADHVYSLATELTDALIEHPSIAESLNSLRTRVRTDLQKQLRAEVEVSIKEARNEHAGLEQQVSEARAELMKIRDEVDRGRRELAEARMLAESQTADLDAEISNRISNLMERPSRVLADVAILRGFLGSGSPSETTATSTGAARQQLAWTRASSTIDDQVALRQELFKVFKSLGIAPPQAIRLHAAVVARVLPVMSGAGALSALIAYSRVVCGGRVAVVHVAPNLLRPLSIGSGDVGEAVEAARAISAPSLVVFEGANRSPTEAYLTPFLQILEALPAEGGLAGISTVTSGSEIPPASLRWAATSVGGAATVPLCRDLWAYAISIHIDRTKRGLLSAEPPTEVELSSELMIPGDTPEDVIEEITETWPLAKEVEASLRSFASALVRFERDPQRLKVALVESSLLPLVAYLQDEEVRVQSLERLQRLVGASTRDDESLTELEQRIRWRLA